MPTSRRKVSTTKSSPKSSTKSSTKSERLASAGWRTGSAQDFLGLSDDEAAYIELRLQLAKTLRAQREGAQLTQEAAAKVLGSSQSRIAKMESGDPTVSLDLLFRALFKLGVSGATLARAIRRCA